MNEEDFEYLPRPRKRCRRRLLLLGALLLGSLAILMLFHRGDRPPRPITSSPVEHAVRIPLDLRQLALGAARCNHPHCHPPPIRTGPPSSQANLSAAFKWASRPSPLAS